MGSLGEFSASNPNVQAARKIEAGTSGLVIDLEQAQRKNRLLPFQADVVTVTILRHTRSWLAENAPTARTP